MPNAQVSKDPSVHDDKYHRVSNQYNQEKDGTDLFKVLWGQR